MADPRAVIGGVTGAAAALALATGLIATWEGKRNAPYRDPIGILTVCYGETAVPMRRYSDAECSEMLRTRTAEFAEGVRSRNPGIAQFPEQWAAHTSFAYNIGLARYSRSSVARLFAAGRPAEACRFMTRYVYAGGRVLRGLVRRRAEESAACLQGVTL
jgi:lysozyme